MTEADRDAILAKIVAFIREVLPDAGTISATTTAADVAGWDSIAHVQVITRVERGFKIRIRSTEIAQLSSVGSLVDLVLSRGRA